jgi:hypothetical protein
VRRSIGFKNVKVSRLSQLGSGSISVFCIGCVLAVLAADTQCKIVITSGDADNPNADIFIIFCCMKARYWKRKKPVLQSLGLLAIREWHWEC